MNGILISGFADEISSDYEVQLQTVAQLGMKHLALRGVNGRGIETYTPEEAGNYLLPKLQAQGLTVSLLGSPLGKVDVDDADAYRRQLGELERLCEVCKILSCHQIRIFSFYLPQGANPEDYRPKVVEQLRGFASLAAQHQITLVHENEKGIYGSTAARCRTLLDEVNSPWLKAAFDFANFVQCGENTADCWETLCKDVADIHIKDAHRGSGENVLCGTGEGQIAAVLSRAICKDGYRGFLTLEPHLVAFDFLKELERKDTAEIIGIDKAKDGAEGYAMQYAALGKILANIPCN